VSISRASKAFFGDSDWLKKVALGALIMLMPYVGTIVYVGFSLRYVRDVAWGRDAHLPEWKDFGEHLKTGFYGFVVSLVYTLPLSLLSVVLVVVAVIGAGAAVYSQSVAAIIWAGVAFFVFLMLTTIVSGAVVWPAYVQVALYNSIQSGFDFKRLWARTRDNSKAYWNAFGKYVLLSLASFGATAVVFGALFGAFGLAFVRAPDQAPVAMMLIYPLELIAIVLLSFISIPLGLMSSHIWGQYARVAYALETTVSPATTTPGTPAEES